MKERRKRMKSHWELLIKYSRGYIYIMRYFTLYWRPLILLLYARHLGATFIPRVRHLYYYIVSVEPRIIDCVRQKMREKPRTQSRSLHERNDEYRQHIFSVCISV